MSRTKIQPATLTDPPARAFTLLGAKALSGLLAAVLVFLFIGLVAEAGQIWPWAFREFLFFKPIPLGLVAIAVAYSLTLARRVPAVWDHVILSCILFILYLSTPVMPLGDRELCFWQAADNKASASQLLSCVAYRLLYLAGGNFRYLSPVVGLVVAFLYLRLCNYLFLRQKGDSPVRRAVVALLYLGSGFQLLFFRNYVEYTQMSLPFLLVSLYMVARYLKDGLEKLDVDILWASAAIAVAGLFHASHIFLLPGIFLAIAARRLPQRRYRLMAAEMGLAAAVIAAAVGLTCGGLALSGVTLVGGSVSGGGDYAWLTPLSVMDSKYSEFGMFSLAHWAQVSNIVTLLFPAYVLCGLIIAYSLIQGKAWAKPLVQSVLTIYALGYLAFVCLWGFDLGFPLDYDLMVELGIPLLLCLTGWVLEICDAHKVLASVIVAVNLLYSWATMSLTWR